MPELEDIVYSDYDEDVGAEADMNNLDAFMSVSPIPTTRVHKDRPFSKEQTIKTFKIACLLDFYHKRNPKRAIGTKWVFRNKKDERGIVIKNKARLVAQGYTQEEGIDYDEVFAPVTRIEAIRLFLAYASFKDFVLYQIDVKSDFLYGKIEVQVYVCQPLGFEDPDFPDKVYKVEKALYGLHQALRAWYETLSPYLLDNGFQRGKIDKALLIKRDKGLQVKQKEDGIFINQDKYVTKILKKFGFTNFKTASTPIETQKPLLKDEDGEEVDVHFYRSMIGSLMYLTSSRHNIMFAMCTCASYQVNPKVSHLYAVKRIFRYLKGQLKLGLWYPKDSPFDLVAYTDSDYAGASLDRKSTTGEAEYVAASSCCGQVLWIQNQLLDYGDCNEKKLIQIVKIHTDKNVADLLTKAFDAKTVNEEVQLQALVDGKKVIITESTIRRDPQLENAEGIACLSNAAIFEQLTLIGYEKLLQKLTFYKAFFSPQWIFLIHIILQCLSAKTTAWNKFSRTMASAIICLATNQMFNFSKYIFESMVKNLDNVGKFLMYPRFVQVFLNKQVDEMSKHNGIYVTPSHTKKIFGNMKRVRKGFSGRAIPLFPTMVKQKPRKHRKDTQIPQSSGPTDNVADEVVNEEMDDSLDRDATTSTSLDTEQDRGNINKTQSKAIPNEPSSPRTSSGGGPRRQETMGDTIAQTGFENVSKTSNDSLLAEVNTPQSDKDSLKLKELMGFFKKLEKKGGSRTHKLKRLYKVGLSARIESSKDEDEDMFGANDLEGDEVVVETKVGHEVVVETEVVDKDVNLSIDEVTLAQALAALKSAKPKADKVIIQELEQGTITTTTAATTITAASTRPKAKGLVIHEDEQAPKPTTSSKDKGKRIMVEEPLKMKKKDQVSFDEQETKRLQAKFDKEERLTREKDEANVALSEEWDNLFVQLIEARKKHDAIIKAKEKRNRPSTKAQKKSTMSTYLKNMAGYKHNQLKNKSFDDIQKLFDKSMKKVNTFVDMDTELLEESSKKAEVMEESFKKAEVEIPVKPRI
ncbi:retrovirus-related pol polyprotein from transposon TNT 1-94 [Tanacetum coccineum]|uniref:Retrovirus-related pol polyprotein from transposon TNT 1-94 n=1 Tax=Tanacetum coccineum TaxID=301880 RepID=A0ABQ5HQA0_9ASTR